MLYDKDLYSITGEDLKKLIEYGVPEDRYIEYKKELPNNSHHEVREFLADVSAFANASGGMIIFGILEDEGVPAAIEGLEIDDVDKEICRLEDIIRNNIKPKIIHPFIRQIKLDDKDLIIIRIPRSWSGPHVVNYQKHWRFYVRTSAGKHSMDIQEVRASMLQNNDLPERMKKFREERLDVILGGSTPVKLSCISTIVLHFIPFSALYNTDISGLNFDIITKNWNSIQPIYSSVNSYRYNLEGFLNLGWLSDDGNYSGYVQVYRNGIFETVDTTMLRSHSGQDKSVPNICVEREIVKTASLYLDYQKQMGVLPPIALLVSFCRVSGYYLAVDRKYHQFTEKKYPLDYDTLRLPELIFEDYPEDKPKALKPLFDSLWNAFGWDSSRNYDKDGIWKLK